MTLLAPTALKGFALSAALIVAIGSQNMFVLRQGLRREHVGVIVLFCALADALLIAAGVGGLGAVLRLIPNLATALAVGGAGFLGLYGIRALRRAMRPASMVIAEQPQMTLAAALMATAGFTLLNPHVYLDTVLLVGAVGSSQPPAAQPAFVAGAALASLLWFVSLGYGARLLSPMFARPAAWKSLDLGVGVTMLGLAASLAWRVVQAA